MAKTCMTCGHCSTNPAWLNSPWPWRFIAKVYPPPLDFVTCTRFGSYAVYSRQWCGEYVDRNEYDLNAAFVSPAREPQDHRPHPRVVDDAEVIVA